MFDRAGTRLAGLAALHGRASGGRGRLHTVRDFDTLGTYHTWAAARPRLAADAPTVLTPRGAHVHVFLRGGDEVRLPMPD
ncbi:MAG TPA: hypothetical protein VD866_07930, partial [Urbifossiella sp.]|nr:hypothetical protein [Urbifossiella sp.]